MNPYLVALRKRHADLMTAISGLQSKASSENRSATDDEMTEIRSKIEEADRIATDINELAAFEQRAQAVQGVAATVTAGATAGGQAATSDGTQTRSATTARDRDPGHYRSTREGGQRSFIADLYNARYHEDRSAVERLDQHNRAALAGDETRAITTTGGASGIVAPHWLVEEYNSIARQGRLVANAVRNIPLGGDPRPMTLPKQTGPTSGTAIINAQTAEGANNGAWGTDQFTTGDDVVTPKTYSGWQSVSRQSLAAATPAIDQLIFAECTSELNYTIETLVCNTMLAGATAATHAVASDANFSLMTSVDNASDVTIDAITQQYGQRFVPADILVPTISRFGKLRKLKDSTGRPIMPVSAYNPMNADGRVTGAMTGEFEGLTVLATAGMGVGGTYPEKFLVARAADTTLFTDEVLQFRFEQPDGPSGIRLGIWTYAACVTRYTGAGTVSVNIAAA